MDQRLAAMVGENALDTQDYIDMLFMRAYMPLTWVLMARTMEVRALTNEMLIMDVPHDRYPQHPHLVHVEVKLTFRKTNQADPRKANTYKLFDLPEEPAAHVRAPLWRWINYVRDRSFGDLATLPHTLVFPQFDGAGAPQYQTLWTDKVFRKALKTVIDGSGIMQTRWGPGTFKSHSLRRGCAQHRAMHVLPHKRWSLAQIRWWGGWAHSESSDILMRYIVEAHDRQQSYYGDSMEPYRRITSANHPENVPSGPNPDDYARLGDLNDMAERTQNVVQELRESMDLQLQAIVRSLNGLSKQWSTSKHLQPFLASATTLPQAPRPPGQTMMDANADPSAVMQSISGDHPTVGISVLREPMPSIPVALSIEDVIRQWEQADPPYHVYPLKDWPSLNPAWHKTETVRARWNQRKRIYEAYVKYADRSISKFEQLFGTKIRVALNAIAKHEGTGRPGRLGQKYKKAPRTKTHSILTRPPARERCSSDLQDYDITLSPGAIEAHLQAVEQAEAHASQDNPEARRPEETEEEYNVRQLMRDPRSPSTERRELEEAAEAARRLGQTSS